MTWLSWRQFRLPALITAVSLLLLAILLAITGHSLVELYNATIPHCTKHRDCAIASANLIAASLGLQGALQILVIALPGLLGIFWGAPLIAREFEAGTHRLVWTQGVTRMRWLMTKLALVGIAAVATAGVVSLMVTWWFSPIDRVTMTAYMNFDSRDIVPIGDAALAFAIGVTAGALLRRTVPAMASTLVIFIAARVALVNLVRPNLIAPVTRTLALTADPGIGYGTSGAVGFSSSTANLLAGTPTTPNAWIYSVQIVNKAGQAIQPHVVAAACPSLSLPLPLPPPGASAHITGHVHASGNPLHACAAKLASTYHELVTYQPASRYWTFQWLELGITLLLALLLLAVCCYWVQRRLS